jgi:hypothetical protein
MPYPRAIIMMAQNLLELTANNPDLHENKFYMLWNSILGHHFPIDMDYGIEPQTSITGTGSKPEFLVVKIARLRESVVLVVELKKPAEDTSGGRDKVKKELVEYIEERFDETDFPVIYAIAGIGLSWAAYKMEKTGSHELKALTEWSSNVTSARDYTSLAGIASVVHEMTREGEQLV